MKIKTLNELEKYIDYSFINTLDCDPNSKKDGIDYEPREVFSGHYTLVKPSALKEPIYISHSKQFFSELGFCDSMAKNIDFIKLFSGDTSNLPNGFKKLGWATGYALSIYGREYYEQCPFQTGNGYGDGRAISILEVVLNNKRWEMQLKGGGQTAYCRGADGKAVLRSSIREFLAQEHMYNLNIPTSRSLSLYTTQKQTVRRPWFFSGSYSKDPQVMIEEYIAISTRVAPSFIRVGQIELFGRRARKNEHKNAMAELEKIVLHLIKREYDNEINENLDLQNKIILLAKGYMQRLSSLVANWIRVGFTQGNFNSDNCAAGGYTFDYGPFGFIDMFDSKYQPWTGGGVHYSFFNQTQAAKRNFSMFCSALKPLLYKYKEQLEELNNIENDFLNIMENKMNNMWASKLGFDIFNEEIFDKLIELMSKTGVDYTIFFRELSNVPNNISTLRKSFYNDNMCNEDLIKSWEIWLESWMEHINSTNEKSINANCEKSRAKLSKKMKKINPKYTLREWFLVDAYEEAYKGNYELVRELQEVMNNPYKEQSKQIEKKYYIKKPANLFNIAGVSHVSCSS